MPQNIGAQRHIAELFYMLARVVSRETFTSAHSTVITSAAVLDGCRVGQEYLIRHHAILIGSAFSSLGMPARIKIIAAVYFAVRNSTLVSLGQVKDWVDEGMDLPEIKALRAAR